MKLTLPLAIGLSSVALAQMGGQVGPESAQGFLTGTPVGLQHVKENAANSALRKPLIRQRTNTVANGTLVKFQAPALSAPGANNPDYSDAKLFDWISAYSLDPSNAYHRPELGDMSTGGDVTPQVDSEGSLEMNVATNTTWLHTTISVDGNAVGQTGSLISRPGTGSSDLFSYVAENSIGIDPAFVDQVRIEYTTAQLDLPNANRGVNAVDWGMGLISRTPNGGTTQLQPVRNLFYFTVSKWWLDMHPSIPMEPYEVYVMEWNGTDWSTPVVAFDVTSLFHEDTLALLDLAETEIDGLSVFLGTGSAATPNRVTFSLTPGSWLDPAARQGELLVSQRYPDVVLSRDLRTERPDPATAPSPTNRGILITDKFGLFLAPEGGDPDNVDGICNKDPKEPFKLDSSIALPMEAQPGAPDGDLGFTMLRDGEADPSGLDPSHHGDLMMQAHGVDLEDGQIGVVVLELEAWRDGELLPFATTDSGYLLALPGEDPPHLFGAFHMDLRNEAPMTKISLRGRALLTVLDSNLNPVSFHESWWSELHLTTIQ